MAGDIPSELRSIGYDLRQVTQRENTDAMDPLLATFDSAANRLAQSWSGSNLGYHSRVYYANLDVPPVGASFSTEWGFEALFSHGTRGDWREFAREDLQTAVRHLTGGASFEAAATARSNVMSAIDRARNDALSLLVTALKEGDDEYLESVKQQIEDAKPLSQHDGVVVQLGTSSITSRDMRAMQGGRESAVHQEVLADVISVRHTFKVADNLVTLVERAASHIERSAARRDKARDIPGDRIFIGHGHSSVWRQLKDFLQDRLALAWDEFNRVPVAGITNVARLQEMLDAAALSFHILTAEDERKDGTVAARQNVIHEAGLFQGRLGFTRAIVMLEEGCEEFSNIEGLGPIPFT